MDQDTVTFTLNGKAIPELQPDLKKSHSFHRTPDYHEVAVYERQSSMPKSRSMVNVGSDLQDLLNEDYLIGRQEASLISLPGTRINHSHVRITEVVPSNSALIYTGTSHDSDSWKTPVKVFSDKRRGKSNEDKKLNRRIRSYYKEQDQLIKAFEDIQLHQLQEEDQLELDAQLQKRAHQLAKASFAVNLILLIAKSIAVALSSSIAIISSLVDSIVDLMSGLIIWWTSRAMKRHNIYHYPEAKAIAVGLSSSVSIISSLVDSAVDLLSGIIIWWTSRAMKNRNIYEYPGGRSRLEPIAIVILSVIMSLASFQLIVESMQIIAKYSANEGSLPSVQLPVILIACGTIVSKFVLYLFCHFLGAHSSSVQVLALDHRNDVVSNIVAIVCGYFGSVEFVAVVHTMDVKYIDPIGAILISIYILVNWWRTGYGQIKLLTGHTADSNFLSKITWICLNHHHEIIYIDTVRAFHFGNNFLVEVDIVLPEEMSLKEAHNIGESLQQKLEKFKLVERAFVHLDYEIEHNPTLEHKMI